MSEGVSKSQHPLFLVFRALVASKTFLVLVEGRAKVLLARGKAEDDPAWWLYGVQPGGLTEGGETPEVASEKFKKAFWSLLEDMALGAQDAVAFQDAVKSFFYDLDGIEELRWEKSAERPPAPGEEIDFLHALAVVPKNLHANVTFDVLLSKPKGATSTPRAELETVTA